MFLDRQQAEVGFDVAHPHELKDTLHGQVREMIHIARHYLEQVVVGAAHGMALNDVLLRLHLGEKVPLLFLILLVQGHQDEGCDLESEGTLVQACAIALHDPGIFQRPHAPKTGGL